MGRAGTPSAVVFRSPQFPARPTICPWISADEVSEEETLRSDKEAKSTDDVGAGSEIPSGHQRHQPETWRQRQVKQKSRHLGALVRCFHSKQGTIKARSTARKWIPEDPGVGKWTAMFRLVYSACKFEITRLCCLVYSILWRAGLRLRGWNVWTYETAYETTSIGFDVKRATLSQHFIIPSRHFARPLQSALFVRSGVYLWIV